MESKTLKVIVVYNKNTEEIVGVFTSMNKAIESIVKSIIENISSFTDFIDDYRTYLDELADRLVWDEDDSPFTTPKNFADWLEETIVNYDSCDWRNNITPFFTFDDVTLTQE